MTTVERVAAWVVVLAAAAAPWAFGATDPQWAAAMAIVCLLAFAAAQLARAGSQAPASVSRDVVIACVLVFAAAAVGLVPAPGAIRRLLLPAGTALLERVDPATSGEFRPLSLAPHATAAALGLAAAYVGAFVVVAAEARRAGGRAVVTSFLVASGVALAALGMAQHLTQRDTTDPRIFWTVDLYEAGTPFGPYVNRNHFAGAMALLAPIAAGEGLAAWASSRKGLAALLAACAAAMLAALVLTESRGGALAAATAAAVLVAATPAGRRLRGALLVAAAVAVAGAVLAAAGVLDDWMERFFRAKPRWTDRFEVQRDAVGVFLGNPVVGTGAGTFADVYSPFQRVCDDRRFGDAHSDWAQLLMETGILGVVAAAAAVRLVVRWARAGLAAAGADRWRVLGPVAGVAAIAAHGLVDVNLHVPANALLTVCALSLARTIHEGPRPIRP